MADVLSLLESQEVLRLAVLFVHIVAVCVATGAVILQDVALVRTGRLDFAQLTQTANLVKLCLIALWISGLSIIWIDTAGNLALALNKPKLVSKLTVVALLTLNGALLHAVAFPALMSRRPPSHRRATLCAVLGAISTATWLYAAFLGIAHPIEKQLGVIGFLAVYGMALVTAIAVALGHVRFVVYRLMAEAHDDDASAVRASLAVVKNS
ncbi:MAG TPA: hypothetical protein VEC14_00605 [Reyranellaceae bacterium]|nr:hypothetical protein [Reyranellaceae bacterium]